ncbi:hypothetical protein IFM89_031775 [Coptis chinensis]|uniref:F-box domain-containing protein n=1 Tax=Coptis chinensis TaxID=261450 RepID=A0A835LK17_9MAGN|nr:hypothetical protein IFM89_031775 [Coptis chinensis]
MEETAGVEAHKRVKTYYERRSECALWNVPEDITANILARLHIRYLMLCRCVCRAWRILISDPISILMHLTHRRTLQLNNIEDTDLVFGVRDSFAKTNFYMVENVGSSNESVKLFPALPSHLSKYKLVASCNGLLCLRNLTLRDRVIIIWNPFTGEILDIPSPNLVTAKSVTHFGFGYDSIVKKYKVLAISYPETLDDTKLVVAEVWTLGLGSWRHIGIVPFQPVDPQFSLEGSLHWMSYERESNLLGIGSFDVRNEEFHFVLIPQNFNSKSSRFVVDTGALGGYISAVNYPSPGLGEIWIMKHFESWTKQYVISMEEGFQYFKPLCLLKSGEILLVYNGAKLVSCDPQTSQIREVGLSRNSHNPNFVIDRFDFVGTFASPMRGGGVE